MIQIFCFVLFKRPQRSEDNTNVHHIPSQPVQGIHWNQLEVNLKQINKSTHRRELVECFAMKAGETIISKFKKSITTNSETKGAQILKGTGRNQLYIILSLRMMYAGREQIIFVM